MDPSLRNDPRFDHRRFSGDVYGLHVAAGVLAAVAVAAVFTVGDRFGAGFLTTGMAVLMAATLLWVGGWVFPDRSLASAFLTGVPPMRQSRNPLSLFYWHELARYLEHTDRRRLEYAFVVGLFVMALLAVAMAGPDRDWAVFLALVAGAVAGVGGARWAKRRPKHRLHIMGLSIGVAAALGVMASFIVHASPT
jgi:hypothetical protein